MSNSFASQAATDIIAVQRNDNPPALVILQRFVAAIEPANAIALKRELAILDPLADSQIRAALFLFPDNFLPSILVALAVAGQRPMLEDAITWCARDKFFNFRTKDNKFTWPQAVWGFIAEAIDDQLGDIDPGRQRTSTLLDELTRSASMFGEIAKDAGSNQQAASGPSAARDTAIKVMLKCIEPIFEAGITEVAAGRDPTTLRALAQQIGKIGNIEAAAPPSFMFYETGWEGNVATILNAFPPQHSRTYPVLNFDPSDKTLPAATPVTTGDILGRRQVQIEGILAFYGLNLNPALPATKKQAGRQQSFAKSAKPASPFEHEGIITLLTMVFLEAYAGAKVNRETTAWDAAIDLLRDLLDRLTAHPGHDLDDNGPDYLATRFPLTLTGDQLHDCAVYAVRVAYWLHALAVRVRAKPGIRLRIWSRAVTLPVHLALVVGIDPDNATTDPAKMPSGGLLFVNNNHLDRLDGPTLASVFASWKTARPALDIDPPDERALHEKFFDDLAAGQFIPGVDMPVAGMPFLDDLMKVSAASVWRRYGEYRKWSKPHEIFGDAVVKGNTDYLGFHLKYLLLLQSRAKFVNDVMIARFWNRDAQATFTNAMGKDTWDVVKAKPALRRYVDAIGPVVTQYEKEIDTFLDDPDDFLNKRQEFEMYRKRSLAAGGTDKLSHRDYLKLMTEDFDKNGQTIVGAGARRAFHDRNSNSSVEDLIGANVVQIKNHADRTDKFLQGISKDVPEEPPFITEIRLPQVL